MQACSLYCINYIIMRMMQANTNEIQRGINSYTQEELYCSDNDILRYLFMCIWITNNSLEEYLGNIFKKGRDLLVIYCGNPTDANYTASFHKEYYFWTATLLLHISIRNILCDAQDGGI